MAVVTLDHITKHFGGGGSPAVDDVSLTIADGEFMVLLGPSGCGKSTTLRMIAGLESITSGTISIDGEPMNRVAAKNRDIAMVFQSYALYPHMTVRKNLAFGLRRRSVENEEIERRVCSVSEMLGLDDLLERKPHALSGGQRQRVALGRAIVRDPKVFLFDEPLSNLDATLRVHTRNELVRLYKRLEATMIYVTHDQVEAMTMGSRICVMNKGKVVQVGEPLEVYRNPADTFVASFIGSPPMNLVPARLSKSGGKHQAALNGKTALPLTGFGADTLSSLKDDRLIVGFRPEDIYLAPLPGEPKSRFAQIDAAVIAAEPLGAETLLIISLDDKDIIVRAGRDTAISPGERITLHVDLNSVHLFDPATTRALPRPAKTPKTATRKSASSRTKAPGRKKK